MQRQRLVRMGHGSFAVDRFADDVEQPSQHLFTNRDLDGSPHVGYPGAARQAVGGIHGHAADQMFAQMLLHLQHQAAFSVPAVLDLERVVDGRQFLAAEIHIDDDTDNFLDGSFLHDHLTGSLNATQPRRRR